MVLQIMRSKKFSRRVLAVFAVVFIPAFLFWGVSGTLSNRQPVIGEISGQKITAKRFAESREAMKVQIILSNFTDYNAIQEIIQNRELLNYMSWERLILLDEAKRQKISVPNQALVAFISEHPLFQKNGVFNNTIYNAILTNSLSLMPRDFEEYVRENLAIQKVRQDILKNINVTEEEVLDFYNSGFGRISCSYLPVGEDLLSVGPEITEGDIKEYYELHMDNFYEPSRVQIEYIEIPYSTVAENEKARKQMTSFYADIVSKGRTFKEAAESAGLRYKSPESFSTETVLPDVPFSREFYDAAFTLKETEISPSIFSHPDNGTAYIIRKIKNYPRQYKTFDEMKDILEEPVREQKVLSLREQKAKDIYADMLAENLSLEQLSDEYGSSLKTAENLGHDGYIEGFGPASDLMSRMEGVSEGETVGSVVSLKGVIIARLDKRHAPDEKDFDDKKDQIRNILVSRKQSRALDEWFGSRSDRVELKEDIKER